MQTGDTALHIAAKYSSPRIAQALLIAGASVAPVNDVIAGGLVVAAHEWVSRRRDSLLCIWESQVYSSRSGQAAAGCRGLCRSQEHGESGNVELIAPA